MHVLRAEIAQRLAQGLHFVEIPDDERQRRLEVSLQLREVLRKQGAQVRRDREQFLVEAGGELALSRRHLRIAGLERLDGVRCHNSQRLRCLPTAPAETTTAAK